jgi:hypothetical protein
MILPDNFEELKHNKFSIIKSIDGGNSTVHCLKLMSGELLALKVYKGQPERILRMHNRESSAFRFLNNHKIDFVSKFISGSKVQNSILYEWISGKTPDNNLEALSAIFESINCLSELQKRDSSFDLAIDAVLSGRDVLNQLEIRLKQIRPTSKNSESLFQSLESRFNTVLHSGLAERRYSDLTYSFSDVGSHNMIMSNSDKFFFIDLEFFGLDSFMKFCADLFVHPKTFFSSQDIYANINQLEIYQQDFADDLILLLPAIALKWCTISARREFIEPHLGSKNVDSDIFIDYFDYLQTNKILSSVKTLQEFKRMRY